MGRLNQLVASRDVHDTTLRLTALLLLLYAGTSALVVVPTRLIAGALLLFPALLRTRLPWWLLVAALVAGNAPVWHTIDNHQFLIAYWVLACAMSVTIPRPLVGVYLPSTARVMIGIVFLFATAWKLVGGEYIDGTFLYFNFLTDPRLRYVTSTISGISLEELRTARDALNFLGAVPVVETDLPLPTSSSLRLGTLLLSWLTVAGEGMIAATHLIDTPSFYKARNILLPLFIGTTYFLLPVVGFAFVLTILGFAASASDDTGTRLMYLALFGIIHLTLIPWAALLVAVL